MFGFLGSPFPFGSQRLLVKCFLGWGVGGGSFLCLLESLSSGEQALWPLGQWLSQGCFWEVGLSRKRLCEPETFGSTLAGERAAEAVSWKPLCSFPVHTFVLPDLHPTPYHTLHRISTPSLHISTSSTLTCLQLPERALSSLLHLLQAGLLPLPLIFFLAQLLFVFKTQPRCQLWAVFLHPHPTKVLLCAPLGFQRL